MILAFSVTCHFTEVASKRPVPKLQKHFLCYRFHNVQIKSVISQNYIDHAIHIYIYVLLSASENTGVAHHQDGNDTNQSNMPTVGDSLSTVPFWRLV